jgi:CBS domain-containing protein
MSVTEMDANWFEPSPRRRLDTSLPVSKLMTPFARRMDLEIEVPRLISVDAFATVREAAHLMASRGLLQVHVRDGFGQLVGVLTASDLYRWVAGATPVTGREDEQAGKSGHA